MRSVSSVAEEPSPLLSRPRNVRREVDFFCRFVSRHADSVSQRYQNSPPVSPLTCHQAQVIKSRDHTDGLPPAIHSLLSFTPPLHRPATITGKKSGAIRPSGPSGPSGHPGTVYFSLDRKMLLSCLLDRHHTKVRSPILGLCTGFRRSPEKNQKISLDK